jgi:hypothetical protein
MAMGYTNPDTLKERFLKKIARTSDTDCWLWIGGKSRGGYGCIGYKTGNISAHRASWIIHFGLIPENLHVLHTCDNPACVSPHHLFLGTNLDNVKDKEAKGRGNHPIGARNSSTKLTAEMVREIRDSPFRLTYLGRVYGVTAMCIKKIKTGENWKHLA